MREITAYRTRDGQLFDSHMCAKSHADKRYSDALTKLAHGALVTCQKEKTLTPTIRAELRCTNDSRPLQA